VYDKLILHGVSGPQLPNFGDDAAVIPLKDEYLLLAADGMMTRLLQNEPYAAGKASVMVTVNDIYSMGGRPLAMVNVLASGDPEHRSKVIDGIRKGCEKLNVPMVGGHLHPDAPERGPRPFRGHFGASQKPSSKPFGEPGRRSSLRGGSGRTGGLRIGHQLGRQLGKDHRGTALSSGSPAPHCRTEMGLRLQGCEQRGPFGNPLHHDGKFREPAPSSILMPSPALHLSPFPSGSFPFRVSDLFCRRIRGFRSTLSIYSRKGESTQPLSAEVVDGLTVTVKTGGESLVLFDFEKDRITGITRGLDPQTVSSR
jgi:hypothetical protein